MWLRFALLVCLCSVVALPAKAEKIEADEALNAMIGKTWTGVNQQGATFWFWHDGGPEEGTFSAKISGQPEFTARGRWDVDGSKVCWIWPHDTYCYSQFGREEGRVWMMRTDGVVHSGELVDGDVEHLRD